MYENNLFEEYFGGESFRARCEMKIRRFISINPKSYRTKNNLKSTTVIKAETSRHILFYRNTIHCFSRFRHFWEILMMITYALGFFIIPLDVSFMYGQKRIDNFAISEITSVIDIICLIDIAINFLSGYQDLQTKEIVLDGRSIARHYVRNYFFIDLLSSLPDRIILMWFFNKKDLINGNDLSECLNASENSQSFGSCVWDIFAILSLIKILQIPLFFKYFRNYLEERHTKSGYSIKTFKNIFTIIICYHYAVCLHFLVLRIFASSPDNAGIITGSNEANYFVEKDFWGDTTDVERYIICFFYTTYTLTLFASPIEERNQVDMVVGIFFTLIGYVSIIWLISECYMYYKTSYGPTVRFQEMRYQLRAYIGFKRIPKSIKTRILTYYDYRFRNKFYRKDDILNLLGGDLRQSIAAEICQEHLRRSYLFKILPENLIKSLVYCMTEAIYLKDDVISRNDDNRGLKLYFIVHGTVAVYTVEGNEVAHLHDGNMFGEMEFLQYRESSEYMNYAAAEECSMLVLQRSDFMRIMAENTELINQMRMLLSEKSFNGTN